MSNFLKEIECVHRYMKKLYFHYFIKHLMLARSRLSMKLIICEKSILHTFRVSNIYTGCFILFSKQTLHLKNDTTLNIYNLKTKSVAFTRNKRRDVSEFLPLNTIVMSGKLSILQRSNVFFQVNGEFDGAEI